MKKNGNGQGAFFFDDPTRCPFCKRTGGGHVAGCVRHSGRPRRHRGPSPEKDEGIARAVAAADPVWLAQCYSVGEQLARTQEFLTSADIILYMEENFPTITTPNDIAVAGVIVKLRNAGIIEWTTNTLKDPRRRCHAKPSRVWRSLIYVGVGVGG